MALSFDKTFLKKRKQESLRLILIALDVKIGHRAYPLTTTVSLNIQKAFGKYTNLVFQMTFTKKWQAMLFHLST